jgi:hypothetical protein
MAATKNKKKPSNMDDLKQELNIDYHMIKPEELIKRLETNLEMVNYSLSFEARSSQLGVSALKKLNFEKRRSARLSCPSLNWVFQLRLSSVIEPKIDSYEIFSRV